MARRKRNAFKKTVANVKNNGRTIDANGQRLKGSPRKVRITHEDVERQFERQGGKCFWWGYKLNPDWVFIKHHLFAMSPDRLDNAGDYDPDNFVVACRAANLARYVCPAGLWAKYCKLMQKFGINPSPEAIALADMWGKDESPEAIALADMWGKNAWHPQDAIATQGPDPFRKTVANVKNNGRTHNPRGQRLKDNARKVRITHEDVKRQFELQGGRCFWWGYKLNPNWVFIKNHPFAMSPDRLDNAGDYDPDNFVIACRAANLARYVCPAGLWAKYCKLMSKFGINPSPEALALADMWGKNE